MDNLEEMQLRVTSGFDEIRDVIETTVNYQARVHSVKDAVASLQRRFTEAVIFRDVLDSVRKRIGPYKRHVAVENFYTLVVEISNTVRVKIVNEKREQLFVANLGNAVPQYSEYSISRADDILTVQFFDYGQLTITHKELDESSHQYDIDWLLSVDASANKLHDSISFCNTHWFGGCLHHQQTWPITWVHQLSPYVPWDITESPGEGYGSTVERYWLSSAGIAVHVEPEVPLFVAIRNKNNIGGLTLVATFKDPYQNIARRTLFLKYSVFQCPDIKQAHDHVRKLHFPRLKTTLHKDMFLHPIWQIQGNVERKDMTSGSVLQYVNDILKHGFEPGTLEIGANWTRACGEMHFDPQRFPETKAVMRAIKNKGFRILLWVHPFAGPKSKIFYTSEHLWIKSYRVDGITTWQHGFAKLLDVTHPTAQLWFETNLKILKKRFHIDGFHFDFGEVNYLPSFRSSEHMQIPENFCKNYIQIAARLTAGDNLGLVKTGARTQHIPLVIAMEGREANWGFDNGLKTVIPSVLTMGLMGYPFVLPPSFIGQSSKMKPSRELYIRWVETVILMPVVQFSVPPWHYDQETVSIVQKLLETRKTHMDYLLEEAGKGTPIVRPLWWDSPKDSIAITVDSQYMVGDRLMVAPVQNQGASHRAIYLPRGAWRDELRGTMVRGGRWLYCYRARLGELPHFMRAQC